MLTTIFTVTLFTQKLYLKHTAKGKNNFRNFCCSWAIMYQGGGHKHVNEIQWPNLFWNFIDLLIDQGIFLEMFAIK